MAGATTLGAVQSVSTIAWSLGHTKSCVEPWATGHRPAWGGETVSSRVTAAAPPANAHPRSLDIADTCNAHNKKLLTRPNPLKHLSCACPIILNHATRNRCVWVERRPARVVFCLSQCELHPTSTSGYGFYGHSVWFITERTAKEW